MLLLRLQDSVEPKNSGDGVPSGRSRSRPPASAWAWCNAPHGQSNNSCSSCMSRSLNPVEPDMHSFKTLTSYGCSVEQLVPWSQALYFWAISLAPLSRMLASTSTAVKVVPRLMQFSTKAGSSDKIPAGLPAFWILRIASSMA